MRNVNLMRSMEKTFIEEIIFQIKDYPKSTTMVPSHQYHYYYFQYCCCRYYDLLQLLLILFI